MSNETFSKEQRAEIVKHMDANRAARGGIAGRFIVSTDIKATAKDSGVKIDADEVLAWLPFDDVPAVVAALKAALAAKHDMTTRVRFDNTGILQIGRRDYGVGVHISPVRAATRGETVLKLTDAEAETLQRALDVARIDIISAAGFPNGEAAA